jgi:FKBP-type peptidyl-prolyl cis-trans isomerase FklB
MRKLFVAIITIVLVGQVATAQNTTKKTTTPPPPPPPKTAASTALKNGLDSLSYAFGVGFGDYLKSVFKQQNVNNPNMDLVVKALGESLKEQKTLMDAQAANGYIQSYLQNERMKVAKVQLEVGDKFLAENKTKPGIQSTPSGLQYQIIKEGTGAKPSATDQVKVHYHGTLIDGKVFDSSVQRGEPATFPVNGVIQGWVEALQLMPTGSKWKLFIPSNLAYGPQGTGGIPPNSVLIFEVELLEIVK